MPQIKKTSLISVALILLALLFLLEAANMAYNNSQKNPDSYSPPISNLAINKKNVLFISSYSPTYPILFYETIGLAEIFEKHNINFDIVYMETKKYSEAENFQRFYDYIKYKFNDKKEYDGIIAGDDAALMFVRTYQNEIFKDIPIVFFAVDDIVQADIAGKNPMITGIYEKIFLTDTINSALNFNPTADKICAIVDNSMTGLGDQKQFFDEKRNFPDKDFFTINTEEKTLDEIKQALKEIDKNTILIFMSFLSDKNANRYSLDESVEIITSFVSVPVYRATVGGIGSGIFGGRIYDFKKAGNEAAQILCDVLLGKRVISEIPVVAFPPDGKYYFDLQVLKKFNLNKKLLPKNTILVNDNPKIWKIQKKFIMPLVFLIISVLLIFAAIITELSYARKAQNVVKMRNIAIARKNKLLKESARKMKIMSENDFLTEIPNRLSVVAEINTLINEKAIFSLYLIDIDDFKNINDYYTHECGDAVLKEFAKRLQYLSQEFTCFIARYGGDEFIIVYKNGFLTRDTDTLDTIKLVLSQPFFYKNVKLDLRFSGGIADSESELDFNDLVSNADLALYNAKKSGKNTTLFYLPKMKAAINEKNYISTILQKHCKNKSFLIHYQPQIDAHTGEIHGFEALCRLDHSEFSPAQFIPIAEECGYIAAIGRIVTEKVISQIASWRNKGLPPKKVAINYSSGQIVDTDYVKFLKSLLEKYDIPSELIEIEITESLYMENNAVVQELFKSLSELGIRLALDDFGTGYSSLSYLTYLHVDKVKIDKTLVDNYLVDGKEKFIKNIVNLVHDLGMKLTVEGVEQQWQFDLLKKLGCDYIQGYFFSKPLPGDDVETFSPKSV